MSVDGGAPINVTDFAEDSDILSERADEAQAATLALATSVIAYFGALSSCIQAGEYIGTVEGDGRISGIPVNSTMPSLPNVTVSLADYTGTVVVGVIAASVTVDDFDAWVFNTDDTPAVGEVYRIGWKAQCAFPDTSSISG